MWYLAKHLPTLYSSILRHPFNEYCIDGTHYSGLYYKIYDELSRKVGLKITEGFAINEWGLICNDVDILGGESNEIMAELIATPLLTNLVESQLPVNLFYHIGTDAAEKQFQMIQILRETAITKNQSNEVHANAGYEYDLNHISGVVKYSYIIIFSKQQNKHAYR